MRTKLILLLAAVCSITAPAIRSQSRTLIVDNQNGPGTFATDLTTAVAAANAGDIIVVVARRTIYDEGGWPVRVQRPITIVGVPDPSGPLLRPLVSARILLDLPSGQHAVLADVDQGGGAAGTYDIHVQRGGAVIVGVTTRQIVARDFEMLSLHDVTSSIYLPSPLTRVDAVNAPGRAPGLLYLHGCELIGPMNFMANRHGIQCGNVDLQVTDSLVRGYRSIAPSVVTPGTGIVGSGRLTVLGGAEVSHGSPPSPAIRWTGEVRIAANATIVGGVAGTSPSSLPVMPFLRHDHSVPLGQPFALEIHGRASATAHVLIGDRPAHVAIPGLDTPLLLDLPRTLPLTVLPLGPTGTGARALTLPNVNELRNSSWFLQGIEVNRFGAVEVRLSGRSFLMLR